MNTKLLLEIFKIPSMSGDEHKMASYIKEKLVEYKVPFTQDSIGNIYNISHANKPLLCSHMDTVQDETDSLLTDFIKIKGNYLSGYGIIGGDDKCGIYIMLEIIKERNVNFLFCVQEEVGGKGSSEWILDKNLDHILYGLVLDRMGSSDILCTQNDYGVRELEIFLHEIGKQFGFSPSMGTFSDADRLNELISCANLSVGYYNPHSKHEFVNLEDLNNSYRFVNSIITHVGEKFEKPSMKRRNRSGRYGGYFDGYYELYDDYDKKHKEDKDDGLSHSMTMKDIECSCCGQEVPTVFLASVNAFICYKCMQLLRDELDDAELEMLRMEEELYYQ